MFVNLKFDKTLHKIRFCICKLKFYKFNQKSKILIIYKFINFILFFFLIIFYYKFILNKFFVLPISHFCSIFFKILKNSKKLLIKKRAYTPTPSYLALNAKYRNVNLIPVFFIILIPLICVAVDNMRYEFIWISFFFNC